MLLGIVTLKYLYIYLKVEGEPAVGLIMLLRPKGLKACSESIKYAEFKFEVDISATSCLRPLNVVSNYSPEISPYPHGNMCTLSNFHFHVVNHCRR